MSSYNYSIANDTQNGLLNLTNLAENIEASTIVPTLDNISTNGDSIVIYFNANLSTEEQATLLALLNAHDGTPDPELPEPELDAEGYPVTRIKGMYIDTSKAFYGRGFSGTATAGQINNMDYTLPNDIYIDKVDIYLKNQDWADKMQFQVVHPVYGVVNQFGENWYVNSSREKQEQIDPPQISNLVPAGMILRIVYDSKGATDVDFKCNFHFQEPIV